MGKVQKKCSRVMLPLTFHSNESKHVFHWMSTDAIQCESPLMCRQKLIEEKWRIEISSQIRWLCDIVERRFGILNIRPLLNASTASLACSASLRTNYSPIPVHFEQSHSLNAWLHVGFTQEQSAFSFAEVTRRQKSKSGESNVSHECRSR
jgi:hypothetical protein